MINFTQDRATEAVTTPEKEEVKTHDDVINEEIEQEHEDKYKSFRVEDVSKELKDKFHKNMKDENLKPMIINFNIKLTKFIDMTDFNKEKFYPHEIDKKRRDYIYNEINKIDSTITKNLIKYFQENDFMPSGISLSAGEYDELDNMLQNLCQNCSKSDL